MDLNNQKGQRYSSGKGATLSPEHKRKISEAMKRKSALISANVSASFTPEKRQAYADRIRGFSKEETARRSRKTGDTNVSEIGDVVNELANYNLVLVPGTYKSASSPFQVYIVGREQEP